MNSNTKEEKVAKNENEINKEDITVLYQNSDRNNKNQSNIDKNEDGNKNITKVENKKSNKINEILNKLNQNIKKNNEIVKEKPLMKRTITDNSFLKSIEEREKK